MAAIVAPVLQLPPDEDVEEHFFRAGFTDGLPVVLPTRARVARMLQGTALAPGTVLGQCPPSYEDVTVERLAIAAVMAGCTPEMFRIVVAAAKAALHPDLGLHGVNATTMGATPVVVVNGPCRREAGVNFTKAPCGSGSRSTSIGRALKLLLQNVGRAKLGGTESTTIGTPAKFGLCFGEWEERCAMWEPLAVASGAAKRDEDAVTVMAVTSGPVQLVDFNATPTQLVERIAKGLTVAYSPHFPLINHCMLVVSPEHHDTLLKAGMTSKAKLAETLWKETSMHMAPYIPTTITTLGRMRFPKVPSIIFAAVGGLVQLVERALNMFRLSLKVLPKFSSPSSFQIVVAGAEAGKFSSFMPGFGVGKPGMPTANMSVPVTVAVEPRPATLDGPGPARSEDGQQVLNPVATRTSAIRKLAQRTGEVAGPVALMDISKARGSELLDVMERKLKAAGVETRRYTKPTFSRPCPEALRRRIASECKSAILGLAD